LSGKNNLIDGQSKDEASLCRDIVAKIVRHFPDRYDIRYDYPVTPNNLLRVDIMLFDIFAHPLAIRRQIGIEVKKPRSIHEVAQGIGQVMIYRQFIPNVWLAMPHAAIIKYYRYFHKLPIRVLDASRFVLIVRSVKYDALKYMKGVRQRVCRELKEL
jgi:hypothetical protein